jgi:hypothetical protein
VKPDKKEVQLFYEEEGELISVKSGGRDSGQHGLGIQIWPEFGDN